MIIHTIRLREVLFVVLVTLFGVFTVQHIEAQGVTLQTVCRWGTFSSGRLFSWATWQHVEFTDAALLASLRYLDASDKFDYDAGGFTPTYELTLNSHSGAHRVDVWTRADDPQHVYLFAYRSATPDARGGSYGRHGCPYGAFRIPMATWQVLMTRMTQKGN
jgi:hypothetical protein